MLKNVVLVVALIATGCSTAGQFVLPQGTTLKIAGHTTEPASRHPGMLTTRALSWSASGGAPYQLIDESGKVVREGKLRTHFRVGSLIFPPFAFLVVPMGLRRDMVYDLTAPADGKGVIDPAPAAQAGAAPTTAALANE